MSTSASGAPAAEKGIVERDAVTIRFAGDSGDGMQLTGSQFTATVALAGNDLATLPDYPAEIRAPAGTTAGVSGFQVQFGAREIFTPGDRPDVLVAMNPAALKVNLGDLDRGALLVINRDAFDKKSLAKAGYEANPLDDDSLESYRVVPVQLTRLTREALATSDLTTRDKDRCKNFFALGLMYWVYGRGLDHTIGWLHQKFFRKPEYADANVAALKAGYNYGDTVGLFQSTYRVPAADIPTGLYRQVTGNLATAYGFIAGAKRAGVELFLGSYPITPASDILHELSKHKNFGVKTFQAEDEIAAVSSAIGASFGGSLGLTSTSGPGLALKGEAIGLAVMVELPLVIANVQRAGPSTGLPTKTEQADLLQAYFGRNGESPLAIVAPATPSDCFDVAVEAVRLATKHMTPVVFLSDGYLANGAEPWQIPDVASLPEMKVTFHRDPAGFEPYARDPKTLARPWVRPGTPELEHRIGGLESAVGAGNVSYDGANHEEMTRLRAEKIARIADDIPPATVMGPERGACLLVGWGGTFGALRAATTVLQHEHGLEVAHLHLRHLNPMPRDLAEVLRRYDHVLCAELNSGQLQLLLRAKLLVDVQGLHKVQGQPFKVQEIVDAVQSLLAARGEG